MAKIIYYKKEKKVKLFKCNYIELGNKDIVWLDDFEDFFNMSKEAGKIFLLNYSFYCIFSNMAYVYEDVSKEVFNIYVKEEK